MNYETPNPMPDLPGQWSDAYQTYAPPLPEGSWERLSQRRKKRRGLFFWIPFGVLFLGLGSGWMAWNAREVDSSKSAESVQVQPQPNPSTPASGSPTTLKKNSTSLPATPLPPASSFPQIVSAKPASGAPDGFKETTPGSSGVLVEKSVSRLPSPTKPLNVEGVSVSKERKETRIATSSGKSRKERSGYIGIGPARVWDRPVVSGKDEGLEKVDNSEAGTPPSGSASTPMARLGEEPALVLVEAASGSASGPSVDVSSFPSTLLVPGDAVGSGPASDTAFIASDSALAPAAIHPWARLADSLQKKEENRRKMGFEASLGLAVGGQTLRLENVPLAGQTEILDPIQIRPHRMVQAALRFRVPLSRSLALYPGFDVSHGWQSVQYRRSPGPQAPVQWVETSGGITGVPAVSEQVFWENRSLWMYSPGLESGLSLSRDLELRAGIHFPWYGAMKGNSPTPELNGFLWQMAVQKQFNRRIWVRVEGRYFQAEGMVRGPKSQSQNLILGVSATYTFW